MSENNQKVLNFLCLIKLKNKFCNVKSEVPSVCMTIDFISRYYICSFRMWLIPLKHTMFVSSGRNYRFRISYSATARTGSARNSEQIAGFSGIHITAQPHRERELDTHESPHRFQKGGPTRR